MQRNPPTTEQGELAPSTAPGLEYLNDVKLLCSVEFGGAEITIRRLLALRAGSVLELSKLQGEPMDIRANGNLVARGEIVVVNDKYGVRITEILDPDQGREI